MLHYFALALESALKEMKRDALSLLSANFKTVSLTLWIKSCSVGMTIQMKATDQYFPVVLFIILHKVVLTFGLVDEILCCDHSNGKLLSSSIFPVVLFILLYRVVLTFGSVDEILTFDHSNESY